MLLHVQSQHATNLHSLTENADSPMNESEGKPKRLRIGPAMLVTAAFIGPGTVVTASKAGAQYGCELLWTVLFASVGTIVLQSIAARLGILNGKGLGESIRSSLANSSWLMPAIVLVISAIGVGNAAYQTGNLTGAATGIESIAGGTSAIWVGAIAVVTAVLLLIGRYRVLQSVLIGLVVLLSLCFVSAALMMMPPTAEIASGLIPKVNAENLTLVLALIGTTIVPYNLFLHASTAAENWKDSSGETALRQSWWDTVFSIGLGGFVTAAILLSASAAFADGRTALSGTADIAQQLQPAMGRLSGFAFGIGLFAAGVTSSITAPLATAYAVCGIMNWSSETNSTRFRLIAMTVLVVGALFAIGFGKSPIQVILFAQLANGILLPIVAICLMVIFSRLNKNRNSQMVEANQRQSKTILLFGWLVTLAVVALALWRLRNLFVANFM